MDSKLTVLNFPMEADDVLVKFKGDTIISVTEMSGKVREIDESKRNFILREIRKGSSQHIEAT